MKDVDSGKEYERQLTKIFNLFNHHFWNDELPEVQITFVPTKAAHGHMTAQPVWVSEDGTKKYELNISGFTINRSLYEVCATLLHEQTHLYNIVKGIKDCSNHNRYHNSRFKKAAESHGLICEKRDSVNGWSHTVLDDDAKKYVDSLALKPFKYKRIEGPHQGKTLIKLVCPNCNNFCYVTRKIYRTHTTFCGECELPMEIEEKPQK